jgi:hypothetical protein
MFFFFLRLRDFNEINMDDNACSVHKNNRSGLSAAEFQRNLYNWYVLVVDIYVEIEPW